MDEKLLKKHIKNYLSRIKENPAEYEKNVMQRREHAAVIAGLTRDRLENLSAQDLYEYVSQLWAMLIWGNKHYVVDKLLDRHGLVVIRDELLELLYGAESIERRWDRFRVKIKGVGPAMMSEMLCHIYPEKYVLWNRRAYAGFNALKIPDLPSYNYQLNGQKYAELSYVAKQLAESLRNEGIEDANLLTVDYFIWDELQGETPLIKVGKSGSNKGTLDGTELTDKKASVFIHNEIRDKVADIGSWLGFSSDTEIKVADGSVVDAVWEATIGNMGRIIYVFEVQTHGSTDSLILNLLKAVNNPAVQGVVAVSDKKQLEKIRKHVATVGGLEGSLRFWNYEEVLRCHNALEGVNESINQLGLVPRGF